MTPQTRELVQLILVVATFAGLGLVFVDQMIGNPAAFG